MSKYSTVQSQEIEFHALDALIQNPDKEMTLDEIIAAEIPLAGISAQKLSRTLNDLVARGLVAKIKNSKGRMTYYSTGKIGV